MIDGSLSFFYLNGSNIIVLLCLPFFRNFKRCIFTKRGFIHKRRFPSYLPLPSKLSLVIFFFNIPIFSSIRSLLNRAIQCLPPLPTLADTFACFCMKPSLVSSRSPAHAHASRSSRGEGAHLHSNNGHCPTPQVFAVPRSAGVSPSGNLALPVFC